MTHLIQTRSLFVLGLGFSMLIACPWARPSRLIAEEPWFEACFNWGQLDEKTPFAWQPPEHDLTNLKEGIVASLPKTTGEYVVHGILDRWTLFAVPKALSGAVLEGSGILVSQPTRDTRVGDALNHQFLYRYSGERSYQGVLGVNVNPHLQNKKFPCFELVLSRRAEAFVELVLKRCTVPRNWQDTTGNYQVNARLISAGEGSTKLQLSDKRVIKVSLDRLSDPDRAYVASYLEAQEGLKPIIPERVTGFLDETSFNVTYVGRTLSAHKRFTQKWLDGEFTLTLSKDQLERYDLLEIQAGTEVEVVQIHHIEELGTFFELCKNSETHDKFFCNQLQLYFDDSQ